MGGICTSTGRSDKIVQARKRNSAKNENILSEDRNTNEVKKDDKNNDPVISDRDSKEKEIKETYPDIIINYMSNGKTEFEQLFKTKDNISNLFDVLLEKKSKYAEYDLIANDKISLSTK
jgi:hypothetical protein